MVIGRKKKYRRHHRRYKKESSNENGGDPPTRLPTNTQPPLTHAATTSNIDATSTITASITTAVINIRFVPTITFAVALPSSVALSVVATYDKKVDKG
jgi:hypothetical protein